MAGQQGWKTFCYPIGKVQLTSQTDLTKKPSTKDKAPDKLQEGTVKK
jgi:hypothetical protein